MKITQLDMSKSKISCEEHEERLAAAVLRTYNKTQQKEAKTRHRASHSQWVCGLASMRSHLSEKTFIKKKDFALAKLFFQNRS